MRSIIAFFLMGFKKCTYFTKGNFRLNTNAYRHTSKIKRYESKKKVKLTYFKKFIRRTLNWGFPVSARLKMDPAKEFPPLVSVGSILDRNSPTDIDKKLINFHKAAKDIHLRFGPDATPRFGSSGIHYQYDRKINNFRWFLSRVRIDDEQDASTNYFTYDFLANKKKNYRMPNDKQDWKR